MNASPRDLASPKWFRSLTLLSLLACAGLACAGGNEMPRDGGAGKGGSGTGSGGTSATTGAGGTSATTGAGGAGGTSATTGAGGTSATTGAGGTSATTGAGGTSATTGAGGTSATTGAGGTTATTGAGGTTGTGTGTGGISGVMRVDLTNKKALIIVDDPASLDDGDVMLRDIMLVRGMVVTFGGAADAAMATGKNVVLISSGETAVAVTSFMNVAVPLIIFSNTFMQPFGLSPAGSANKGTIDGHTMLAITDTTTSLAAGLAANATLQALLPSRNASIYWATPGGQAIKVLSTMGSPTQGMVFAFEKGAMTATGTAPARRVAFAWRTNVLKDITIDAFKLLSAGIEWTAGTAP